MPRLWLSQHRSPCLPPTHPPSSSSPHSTPCPSLLSPPSSQRHWWLAGSEALALQGVSTRRSKGTATGDSPSPASLSCTPSPRHPSPVSYRAAPAFWFDPALLARSLLYSPQISTPRIPMEGQTDKRWHSLNCGSSGPSHLQGHTHALLPWEHTPCTHLARSGSGAHSASSEPAPHLTQEKPGLRWLENGPALGAVNFVPTFSYFFSPPFFLFSKHLSQPFLPFLKEPRSRLPRESVFLDCALGQHLVCISPLPPPPPRLPLPGPFSPPTIPYAYFSQTLSPLLTPASPSQPPTTLAQGLEFGVRARGEDEGYRFQMHSQGSLQGNPATSAPRLHCLNSPLHRPPRNFPL